MASAKVAPETPLTRLDGGLDGDEELIKPTVTSWGDIEVNKQNVDRHLSNLKENVNLLKVGTSFWIEIYQYKVILLSASVFLISMGSICVIQPDGLDPDVALCVSDEFRYVAVGLYFGSAVFLCVIAIITICNKKELKVDPMREAMMYQIQYRHFQEAFDKAQFKKWDKIFSHINHKNLALSDMFAGSLIILFSVINASNINYNFFTRGANVLAAHEAWGKAFYTVTWTEELVIFFAVAMIFIRAMLCLIDKCRGKETTGRRLERLSTNIHTVSSFSLLRGLSMRHTAWQIYLKHKHKRLDVLVLIPLMLAYFCFGMLAMFIKITVVSSIVQSPWANWEFRDVITILAFYNNVLSIVDVKGLRKHAILLVSFGGENAELEEDEMQAVSEFFYRLAYVMVQNAGFLGFLRYIQLDGKDLQKWLFEDHESARTCSYEITNTTEVTQVTYVCRTCTGLKGPISRKLAKKHGICMSCKLSCHVKCDTVRVRYQMITTYCSCGDGQFANACQIMNCVEHMETI